MTPKLVFTAIFIVFISLCQAQETARLSGDVTVRLKKKELTADYQLTNIVINSPKMSFMLHEDFDVEQVYLNDEPIASSKNGKYCNSCKVHTIWIDRDITPQDVIRITVEGDLENFAGKDVAYRNGVFEASAAQKWYPVLLSDSARTQGVSFSSHTRPYIYDLSVKCGDCQTIRMANVSAADNHFHGTEPTTDIHLMLSTQKMEDQSTARLSTSVQEGISQIE